MQTTTAVQRSESQSLVRKPRPHEARRWLSEADEQALLIYWRWDAAEIGFESSTGRQVERLSGRSVRVCPKCGSPPDENGPKNDAGVPKFCTGGDHENKDGGGHRVAANNWLRRWSPSQRCPTCGEPRETGTDYCRDGHRCEKWNDGSICPICFEPMIVDLRRDPFRPGRQHCVLVCHKCRTRLPRGAKGPTALPVQTKPSEGRSVGMRHCPTTLSIEDAAREPERRARAAINERLDAMLLHANGDVHHQVLRRVYGPDGFCGDGLAWRGKDARRGNRFAYSDRCEDGSPVVNGRYPWLVCGELAPLALLAPVVHAEAEREANERVARARTAVVEFWKNEPARIEERIAHLNRRITVVPMLADKCRTEQVELRRMLKDVPRVAALRIHPSNFPRPPLDFERALQEVLDDPGQRRTLQLETERMMRAAVDAWEATARRAIAA